MKQTDYNKKWIAKNLANGLCASCGLPAEKGVRRGEYSRYCRKHQLAHANYMREYMADRRRNEQRNSETPIRA